MNLTTAYFEAIEKRMLDSMSHLHRGAVTRFSNLYYWYFLYQFLDLNNESVIPRMRVTG